MTDISYANLIRPASCTIPEENNELSSVIFLDDPTLVNFDNIEVPIIVLDIDGTFFHLDDNWNIKLQYFQHLDSSQIFNLLYLSKLLRPGTIKFFKYVTQELNFKIVIWTAGSLWHAKNIVKLLLNNEVNLDTIHSVIHRGDSWVCDRFIFTKNIKLLKYPLEKITIIDDLLKCVLCVPDNALIIPQFDLFETQKDVTLYYIMAILLLWKEENEKNKEYKPICHILNKIDYSIVQTKVVQMKDDFSTFIHLRKKYSEELLDELPNIRSWNNVVGTYKEKY
jgi:hypothetical protein